MISSNDTSILAMFSRHPNLSDSEIDENINKIDHPENKLICQALLGKIKPTELTEDQENVYWEVKEWSSNRTCQIRNEQILSRRRNQSNKLRDKMIDLYERGKISNEVLMLYAMSGSLPDALEYNKLKPEQKQDFWLNRIEERLENPNRVSLREFRGNVRKWLNFKDRKVNWKKEGF